MSDQARKGIMKSNDNLVAVLSAVAICLVVCMCYMTIRIMGIVTKQHITETQLAMEHGYEQITDDWGFRYWKKIK